MEHVDDMDINDEPTSKRAVRARVMTEQAAHALTVFSATRAERGRSDATEPCRVQTARRAN